MEAHLEYWHCCSGELAKVLNGIRGQLKDRSASGMKTPEENEDKRASK